MDNFKFYIGDAKNLTTENLIWTKADIPNLGKRYRLYRNNERTEKDWYLRVYVKQTECKASVTITGSIRKWYYGQYTFRNLTKEDFEDCIDQIAERLGLSENEMWGAKIMNGEISLSLILKSNMAYFLHSFVKYKEFDVMRYSHTSLAFIGECKALKFYNAGRLVWNKLGFSKKKIARIEGYFLRYRVEVKIDEVLHVEKRMGKILSNPGTILNNWNEIYAHLRMYIAEVECFGIPSDVRSKLEGGSRKDFENYLLHAGMLFNTPQKCFEDILLLKAGKPRTAAREMLKRIQKFGNYSTRDKEQFLSDFDRKVAQICPT